MPLASGPSCTPSASVLAEPQGRSNFPQLLPPEFKIGTTTGLASELPLSNRPVRAKYWGILSRAQQVAVRAISASVSLRRSRLADGWSRSCRGMSGNGRAQSQIGILILQEDCDLGTSLYRAV